MLKQEDNAEYVLNTEDPNFETDLKNLSEKVKKIGNTKLLLCQRQSPEILIDLIPSKANEN